jgi:hypothetical protein
MIKIAVRRPSIFIGSSAEQHSVASAVQFNLDVEYEPTVWSQDIFQPSSYALIDLVCAAGSYNFAIFVFAPDDIVLKRGSEAPAVRDNVIFELGLFMGALQPERCFIVIPRGGEKLRLPTDLLGFAPLTYRPDRGDRNLVAAVGPACFQIKCAIDRQFSFRSSRKPKKSKRGKATAKEQAMVDRNPESLIAEWNGPDLTAAREAIRELPLDHYSEEAQRVRPYLKRLFRFLDEMAAAVLDGRIDEVQLRPALERAVLVLWPHFYTLLAPPNQADEWWETRPPKLAELHARWSAMERT